LADDLRFVLATVHPHGRGERMPVVRQTGGIAGSSPRAWGTLVILA